MSNCAYVGTNCTFGNFKDDGKSHVTVKPFYVDIKVDGKPYRLLCLEGYKCDGLSVPRMFRWFLPSWDKKNIVYNLSGVLHDSLYCLSGAGYFTREQCDDVLRGVMRDSGISRFKSGVADKAVEWFANRHFGDDSLHCRDKILFSEWF